MHAKIIVYIDCMVHVVAVAALKSLDCFNRPSLTYKPFLVQVKSYKELEPHNSLST